jgi:hypothetical protein
MAGTGVRNLAGWDLGRDVEKLSIPLLHRAAASAEKLLISGKCAAL